MSSFLEPLCDAGSGNWTMVNARTGRPVASSIELARTRTQRRRGLLGRDGLDAGSAFVLAPCHAVHTIGMRFPIDVAFVDDEGVVVKTVSHMGKWRLTGARSATITIEMCAGALSAADLRVGDRVCLTSPLTPKPSPRRDAAKAGHASSSPA
jgi:uncharacterized membrane protein (UPF0127 family)